VTDTHRHWSDPGVEMVSPGVHRMPLPLPMDGLRAVNVYVLETESGLTCIDAGWAVDASRKAFEEGLRSIGHAVTDVTRFLVTHAHRDHYTQAVTVRRELGRATIELGLGEKPTLDLLNGPEYGDADPIVDRLVLAGAHDVAAGWHDMFDGADVDTGLWAPPDAWVEGEQVIEVGERRLRAVPTPGHTAGHFVFADEEAGLLFAGDHVLPTITPSIGFTVPPVDQPLRDFMESLAKVRALPDLQILPAHGPVAPSSHERVDELLVHHEKRLDLSLAALASGPLTGHDVAQHLPWTRHDHEFVALDIFSQGMAAMETKAHLELLVARGQATREDTPEGVVFTAVANASSTAP
jgi:glyoxylase-like metal-dependent hydrolase (beta-lactamase superfamily II)